MVADLVDARL